MKITIPQVSSSLHDIMGKDIDRLSADKGPDEFRLTVQNLSAVDVYIENGEAATVAEGYKLYSTGEVEIKTPDLTKLYFIADGGDATDVRVITN